MKLPDLYIRNSRSQDREFLEYMFSVIYVESKFDRNATSGANAYGLMQMTMPAVLDATEKCQLKPVMDLNHLHDSVTNIRYGTCYLKHALEQADGDWTRALIMYNGGYSALTKYDNGENIPNETAQYVLRVQHALKSICRINSMENKNVIK